MQPSTFLPTYLNRARHFFTHTSSVLSQTPAPSRILDVFTLDPSAESESFVAAFSSLVEYVEEEQSQESSFGAFDLTSLHSLCAKHGQTSVQCEMGQIALRGALQIAISQPNLHLAIVTLPSVASAPFYVVKRQPPQSPFPPNTPTASPQLPISGISTCFTSEALCNSGTSSCSGRGSCVAASKMGRTCYLCACNATIISEDGKAESWVGDSCERKDVSGYVSAVRFLSHSK